MTGIYKFTNKINNKSYIGQSIDIEKRRKTHIQRAFCNTKGNKEYNKTFYKALRKYGVNNFSKDFKTKITKRAFYNIYNKKTYKCIK